MRPINVLRSSPPVRVLAVLTLAWTALTAAPPARAQGAPGETAPPVEPLAAVLQDRDGDRVPDRVGQAVAVEVVATTHPVRFARDLWGLQVQDSTGGIVLLARDSAVLAGVSPGDRVRAGGEVGFFMGGDNLQVASFERLGPGEPPQPRPVLAGDLLDERYSGQLVSLSGELVVVASGGQIPRLELRDRSGRITLFPGPAILDDPAFVQRLLRGGRAEVVGIAGQWKEEPPYDAGYVVFPRTARDLHLTPAPPYGAIATGTLLMVLVLALGYVAVRRRGAERRARAMAALSEELRRSEEALRESEARLRLFISQTPAALWSTDRELRVTFWGGGPTQDAEAGGRPVRRALAEYLGTDDPEFPPLALHRRALAGQPGDFELERQGRNFQARVEPLHGADGSIAGVIGVAFDVTQRKRVEAALRESERHFRALIEHAHDVVTVLGPDGAIRYQSPGSRRVLGYDPDEVIGRTGMDLVHPDDLERMQETLAAVLREPGASTAVEVRVRHRDGSLRHLQSVATNLLHDPAVAGVVVNSRDITERRNAEEALSLQTAYYEQLFEAAPEGIIVLDTEKRVLRANREFLRMFGFRKEEVEGKVIDRLIVPEDRQHESHDYGRRTAAGKRVSAETVRVRRDGTAVQVSILATPVQLDGRAVAIYGIYRDIGERKHAEEALLRREAQLAEAQQIAHLGSWEYDMRTGVTTWSDELWRICGLAPGTFTPSNERFLERVHPEDRERVQSVVHAAIHFGQPYTVESRMVRPDGSVRIVESRTEVIRDERGEPVRLIGTGQDVTEWRHLEEQLRHSQKMEAVGRLAGGIAHDFNNLLTAIRGHAELLRVDLPEESPFRADVDGIVHATTRAAALTRQLLAYSRKQVMQPRVLDLNAVVASSGDMLRRMIGEDVHLHADLCSDLGSVRADPGQIEQVLMNLVVNARDAMPGGGVVSIETRSERVEAGGRGPGSLPPGRYSVLSVKDTGCGMDPATVARIFEPFFTTKEVGKGTGLGLSTAYGIVRQSGGEIAVHSEPEKGSVLEVYLPCVDVEEKPAVEALPSAPVRTEIDARATVLLVEDEAGVRDLVLRVLERGGYRVLVAGSAAEALVLAETHAAGIDLLVSDVRMPGMSGPALAERITARHPGLRILFMSGHTDDAVLHHGALSPGTEFLQKPFPPRLLAERIRAVLDRTARAA